MKDQPENSIMIRDVKVDFTSCFGVYTYIFGSFKRFIPAAGFNK